MTIADKARDAAIHCEMKKVAYRQTKDGIVVSFVLHPQEVPVALSTSHIGARYIAALVEIGDDELPVPQTEKEAMPDSELRQHNARPQPNSAPAGAKRDWRELQPQQQAGIRCDDATFRAFLFETRGFTIQNPNDAAIVVRNLCGVNSRSELASNHKARVFWHQLDNEYQAWLAKERVGA